MVIGTPSIGDFNKGIEDNEQEIKTFGRNGWTWKGGKKMIQPICKKCKEPIDLNKLFKGLVLCEECGVPMIQSQGFSKRWICRTCGIYYEEDAKKYLKF